MHRRSFLERTTLITAAGSFLGMNALADGESGNRENSKPNRKKIRLKSGDVVLFTGDSITDASRVRKLYDSPNIPSALGSGYATLTAAKLYRNNPKLDLKFHNTGISGNTIVNLMDRWERDCVALKPTILSILIGVNDFNGAFTKTGHGDPRRYEREYRELLQRTHTTLPGVRLVIGEPYALKGVAPRIDAWYPEFVEYPAVARKIAEEFNAIFIPYQKIYDEAGADAPAKYYSNDGMHPSLSGIELMSKAWLDSTGI